MGVKKDIQYQLGTSNESDSSPLLGRATREKTIMEDMLISVIIGLIILIWVVFALVSIAGIFGKPRPIEPEETKEQQAERACALDQLIRNIPEERL